MSQSDSVPWGPAPTVGPNEVALGAMSFKAEDGGFGVVIALRGAELVAHDNGVLTARISLRIEGAVQCVQAIRQAIADARKGRVR